MSRLTSVLFSKSLSYDEKVEFINNMSDTDLRGVEISEFKEIVKAGGGEYEQFRINSEFREIGSNHWNSTIEGAYLYKGYPYLFIYVQGGSTDTTMSEDYSKFFSGGDYRGYCERLNCYVTYTAKDKANVMKALLLGYVYTFSDEAQRLGHITSLRNGMPARKVSDRFYNDYASKWSLSRSSSDNTIRKDCAYRAGSKAMNAYIAENVDELFGKSDEELTEIFTKVFIKAIDDTMANLNVYEWRSNHL